MALCGSGRGFKINHIIDVPQKKSSSNSYNEPFNIDRSGAVCPTEALGAYPRSAGSRKANPLCPTVQTPCEDFPEGGTTGASVSLQDIEDVFIHEIEEMDSFPYLDVVTIEGGVSDIESVEKLSSIDMCGGSSRIGRGYYSHKYSSMPNYCKLIYCPSCSREKGPIEQLRKGRLFQRIDVEKVNIRGIVYTVPIEHRSAFKSRKGLNALLRMADGVTASVFGKNSKRSINPHLVGDKSAVFNPHLCSMVFENLGVKLKVDQDTLGRLNALWKKRLSAFLKIRLDVVDVHYEFKTTVPQKLHLINYNLRANFNYDEDMVMFISSKEMKKFNWLRFRGEMKMKEKDHDDTEVVESELEKQVGEPIIWLGTVSAKELRMRFADIEMRRIPGPYEIYVETDEAFKKRRGKALQFDFIKKEYKKNK